MPHSIGDVLLGEIGNQDGSIWTGDIKVNHTNMVTFKLDMGAAVSLLSDKVPMLHAENTLGGPGGIKLRVLGTLVAKLQYKNKTCNKTLCY